MLVPFASSTLVCCVRYDAGVSTFWFMTEMSQRARSLAVIASSPAANSHPLPSLGATRAGPNAFRWWRSGSVGPSA